MVKLCAIISICVALFILALIHMLRPDDRW